MNKIIEIKEEVQIGDVILEKGDRIKLITEDSNTTKVYPVLAGANAYSLRIDDVGERYMVNGDIADIANQIQSVFGSNVSSTDIADALQKKGRGASFTIFRSQEIVRAGLKNL